MTVIKEGYNGKPTHIGIEGISDGKAYLNIQQEGTEEWLLGVSLKLAKNNKQYKDFEVVQDEKGNRFVKGEIITKYVGKETLAYVTIEELINLRNECNTAIRGLAGL